MNNHKAKVYSQIVDDLTSIREMITEDLGMEWRLKLIHRWMRDIKEYEDWEPREFLNIKLEQIEMMTMLGYDDELIINELNEDIKWWRGQIMEVCNER